jgi:putative endonuclease
MGRPSAPFSRRTDWAERRSVRLAPALKRCLPSSAGAYVARMSVDRQATGERGERVAARWLAVHGWSISQHRFRNGHRDIDLVATRRARNGFERTVAFVEVKTRRSLAFGGPLVSVGWRKKRELIRSAKVWISRFKRPGDTYRFDVIGVILGPQHVRIQHVENAFLLEKRT